MIRQRVNLELVNEARASLRLGVPVTYDYGLNAHEYTMYIGGATFETNVATVAAITIWAAQNGLRQMVKRLPGGRRLCPRTGAACRMADVCSAKPPCQGVAR